MKKTPLVSICIPTYNAENLIIPTLNSIFKQSYKNFEIIINDDCSKDRTVKVIESCKSKKIRIYQNKKNLGYGDNIKQFKRRVRGEIIFLMAQDDFLINEGLRLTVDQFIKHPQVGVVTRPYYWFNKDPKIPIRQIPPANKKRTVVIDVNKNPEKIIPIIESVGQLSGLAYRSDLFTQFHSDVFPAHIYPFMEILREHKCAFLHKYTIAVGTYDSQTRSKSSIYDLSPTYSWMRMFDSVFKDRKYATIKKISKDHMAKNYIGLIQLKNFAKNTKILYREIFYLIKYRYKNLLSFKFWFFSIGTIIIPRKILIPMVDNYKNVILKNWLSKQ